MYVRLATIALLALSPAVALAATPKTFSALVDLLIYLINGAIGVLVLAAVVIYLYGASTSILSLNTEHKEKMKAFYLWGILALFIMVSIWGILSLLRATLFPGAQSDGIHYAARLVSMVWV